MKQGDIKLREFDEAHCLFAANYLRCQVNEVNATHYFQEDIVGDYHLPIDGDDTIGYQFNVREGHLYYCKKLVPIGRRFDTYVGCVDIFLSGKLIMSRAFQYAEDPMFIFYPIENIFFDRLRVYSGDEELFHVFICGYDLSRA